MGTQKINWKKFYFSNICIFLWSNERRQNQKNQTLWDRKETAEVPVCWNEHA